MIVPEGNKLVLRCLTKDDADLTWYKDEAVMRGSSTKIKLLKQSLRFKNISVSDSGNYACRLESPDSLEWRNVTVRVEGVQNDGYQSESSGLGRVMGALRPEEETNELEIESRST